jgi:hypothetical protein
VDLAITGLTIIVSFSVAHERALELARWVMDKLPPSSLWLRAAIDWLTRGPGAIVPACTLAVATHANLLDAFRQDGSTAAFFRTFMSAHTWPPTGSDVVGCLLMGLAVSYGAPFGHELLKGLMDLRGRLHDTRETASPAPPVAPQRALLQEQY